MNDYLFEGKNIINNAGRIFPDVELVRKRAANIKYRTLEQLDKYLIEFEENVEKNNGKILWAYSKKDILRTVRNLLIEFNYHNVLIGGGSILDEIEIRSHLFKKKEKLLQKKEKHDVVTGIYGANFLIADAGTAVIAELMDNIIPQHKYPKNIIIIAGIEQLLPSLKDLAVFIPLVSTFNTEIHVNATWNILSGPGQDSEKDSLNNFLVILFDNYRTTILKDVEQRNVLSCVSCKACSLVCPISHHINDNINGNNAYRPINLILTPLIKGIKDFNHLSYASTLCRKCSEICPLYLPLHEHLLTNRAKVVINKAILKEWKQRTNLVTNIILQRWIFHWIGVRIKNKIIRKLVNKYWGTNRKIPDFAKKSFKEYYKEVYPERK